MSSRQTSTHWRIDRTDSGAVKEIFAERIAGIHLAATPDGSWQLRITPRQIPVGTNHDLIVELRSSLFTRKIHCTANLKPRRGER